MYSTLILKSLAGVLVASGSSLGLPGPTQADDPAPPEKTANYECQSDGDAAAEPTPVKFTLGTVPASVRPGDVVSLSGKLTVTLSDTEARKSTLSLANNAKIEATDFPLVVTAGGQTTTLEPLSLTSAPRPVGTPFRLSAQVSYPDMTIPETSTGAVVITMPTARKNSAEAVGAPEKVTFNANLAQDSAVVPERKLGCWASSAKSATTIARLRVAERGGDRGAGSTPSDTSPGAGAGASGAAGPTTAGEAAASTDGAGPDVAPQPDSAVPPADTSVVAAAPADATVVADAPIPAASVSDDTFVPGWILAIFIALFPAAAITFAAKKRRALRRLVAQTTSQ